MLEIFGAANLVLQGSGFADTSALSWFKPLEANPRLRAHSHQPQGTNFLPPKTPSEHEACCQHVSIMLLAEGHTTSVPVAWKEDGLKLQSMWFWELGAKPTPLAVTVMGSIWLG